MDPTSQAYYFINPENTYSSQGRLGYVEVSIPKSQWLKENNPNIYFSLNLQTHHRLAWGSTLCHPYSRTHLKSWHDPEYFSSHGKGNKECGKSHTVS